MTTGRFKIFAAELLANDDADPARETHRAEPP